jgi:hypothetical protein
MRTLSIVSFVVFWVVATVFANDNRSGGRVSDTTRSSAKIGDILSDPNNVDMLDNIVSGVVLTTTAVRYAVSNGGLRATFGELRDNSQANLQQYREGLSVRYKNSKGGMGFFNFIRTTQGFLLDILNTASDRIDMWRTTLPTLRAWGDSMARLVDNTRQVYTSFRWSDLWDIDREWSRQMERVNMRWISQYHGFLNFLRGFETKDLADRFSGNYIQIWRADSIRATTRLDVAEHARLVRIQSTINSEELAAMDALTEDGRALLFRRLPIEMQETAIIGLVHTRDIMQSAENRSGSLETMQRQVSNPNTTYLESKALLAHIKQQRADIETQRVTLQQIQSNMATIYARVQMMGMEEQAAAQDLNTRELARIVNFARNSGEELSWEANRGIDWGARESVVQ